MARADSTSTTRRNFLRLAAVNGAVVATAPMTFAADNVLVQLSADLNQVKLQCDAAETDEVAQTLYRAGRALCEKICETDATSVAGLAAKCRALMWIYGDKAEEWDCPEVFGLIENVFALNGATGA